METRNDGIIKKIKGLLAIANDNQNDEESQSAFMMAQKLMMKHDISMGDVDNQQNPNQTVDEGQVTAYKKLFWWERKLAQIISKNFKVKFFYSNKYLNGERNVKRSITFLGYKQDIALAKEMYILAYEVIVFYAKRFVDKQYEESGLEYRDARHTKNYKDSYMKGFLDGMNKRFEEQVSQMKQEYGLMVLVPVEVEEKYEVMFGGKKGLDMNIPSVKEANAYAEGFKEGKQVDYTKSTINDTIIR